jgi:hypothetical protein
MKFLLTYQQSPNTPPPTPEKMAAIGKFSQENIANGTVIMTGGLVRPTRGVQVRCEGGKFTVTDGPFAETKELIDGFALVNAENKDAAIRIAESFMKIAGDGTGEILQWFDQADMQGPPKT